MSILSIILYGEDCIFGRICTKTGELRNYSGRSLTRDSTDTQNTEKMESAHTSITAEIGFLIVDGEVRAFIGDDGKAVTPTQARKEGFPDA